MMPGETLSLWTACSILRMIGLPGDRNKTVAQNAPNSLGRQAPQGIIQIIA